MLNNTLWRGLGLRLITKLNIFFGIILVFLMVMVFTFTQSFFQKELEAQVETSLRVTYESFKLTLDNIFKEQQMKAETQTKRDIISLSTKDRINPVLNYYLNSTAQDYNIQLIEVLDSTGNLLADNNHSYEEPLKKIEFRKPSLNKETSYITRRGDRVYLVTTSPIMFAEELVGYMNIGTLVDKTLISYFSSVLHKRINFYAEENSIIGNIDLQTIPEVIFNSVQKESRKPLFYTGNNIDIKNYDFIFFKIPSDNSFSAILAIANNRSEVQAALLRLKVFLLLLTGFGFVFGFIGSNTLARNIKKSIFGMEPQEIASLLDQQTTILQSTFEGIIALDHDGKITLINKEAQKMLPSNIEIIGQPTEIFLGNLRIKEVLKTGQAIFNQQQVIGESVVVLNCVPIKTKNRILGAVITLRDLTEFQKVAEELVEVKNYTQALRAQSHEFRNKLQSISGLIQLGKYETALTLLHEVSVAHQDLISQLANSFSNSAVAGILLGKYDRAKEINIRLEIDRSSFIPKNVFIPDNDMVCIVGNLIENAFEALQETSTQPKLVKVKIYPVRQYLRIAVIDNGPGIPKPIRSQIFQRGFTTKKGMNKGIGLNLVKQIVANLRGSIKLRSNRTTIFIVKLPLKNGGNENAN